MAALMVVPPPSVFGLVATADGSPEGSNYAPEVSGTLPPSGPPLATGLGTNLSVAYSLALTDGNLVRGNVSPHQYSFNLGSSAYDPRNGLLYVDASPGVLVYNPSTSRIVGQLGSSFEYGAGPVFVATTGLLYGLVGNGTLEAVSPVTGLIVASIDVRFNNSISLGPDTLTWDPLSGDLLVSGIQNSTLIAVNLTRFSFVQNYTLGFLPSGVVYDSGTGRLYIADHAAGRIAVLDGLSGAILATISLASAPCPAFVYPEGITLDPANGEIYMVESSYGSGGCIIAVSTASNAWASAAPLGLGNSGVVYDTGTNQLFVGDYNSEAVWAVDPYNLSVTRPVPIADDHEYPAVVWAPWSLTVVPELSSIYLSLGEGDQIVGLDPVHLTEFSHTFTEGKVTAIVYDPLRHQYVVADWRNSRLVFVDPSNFSAAATTYLNGAPNALAYDPLTKELIVVTDGAFAPVARVEFLNATTAAVVGVLNDTGAVPETVGVDPATGVVYYPTTNGDLRAVDPLNFANNATIPIGGTAGGLAFDPTDHRLFVANSFTNVTVIDTATNRSIASIPTPGPGYIAWDSFNDRVYASNTFNSNVTIIDPVTDTANGSLPARPYAGALVADPNGSYLYVADNAGNVTALNLSNGTGTTISVGIYTNAVALGVNQDLLVGDWTDGTLYELAAHPRSLLANASFTIQPSVVARGSPITLYANVTGGTGPLTYSYSGLPAGCIPANLSSFACSPTATGRWGIGLTVHDSVGVERQLRAFLWVTQLFNVTFIAEGLASGTTWNVSLDGQTVTTATSFAKFIVPNGTYGFSIGPPPGLGASPPSGTLVVAGLDTSQPINFYRVYTATFDETGLPGSTPWGVTVAGLNLTSSTSTLAAQEPNGSYGFVVNPLPGFGAAPPSGTVSVSGSDVTTSIVFSKTFPVTFQENGIPLGNGWTLNVAGSNHTSYSSSLLIYLGNGSWSWTAPAAGAYVASPGNGTVVVAGSPASVVLAYTRLYGLTFTESGLAVGTGWSVAIGGTLLSGRTTNLTTAEGDGSYRYSVTNVSGYSLAQPTGTLVIAGAPRSIQVTFAPNSTGPSQHATFVVTFEESGLPTGASWGFTINGSTHTLAAGVGFGVKLENGSYSYSLAAVIGFVTPASGNVDIAGAPVTILVTYDPNGGTPAPQQGPPFTGFTLEAYALAGLAVIAVAVIVGLILSRRRGPGKPEIEPAEEALGPTDSEPDQIFGEGGVSPSDNPGGGR
ncbi:MAG: hypothetical protein L3K10_02440 [Thermoplasmata archaeon]|nr:hypothetical protein [Thermoplasmata archaeon]